MFTKIYIDVMGYEKRWAPRTPAQSPQQTVQHQCGEGPPDPSIKEQTGTQKQCLRVHHKSPHQNRVRGHRSTDSNNLKTQSPHHGPVHFPTHPDVLEDPDEDFDTTGIFSTTRHQHQ